MSTPFFPFTRYVHSTAHFTSSDPIFRDTFFANKPKGLTWFAYDVVIKSATLVDFVVYDMLHNVYGGIGKQIATFEATVPESLTKPAIEAEALQHAKARRAAELAAAEEEIIAGYASELLAELEVTG